MVPLQVYRVIIKSESKTFSCVKFVKVESLNDAWSAAEDELHKVIAEHKELDSSTDYKWFVYDINYVNEVK